jgi:hypothetical protein
MRLFDFKKILFKSNLQKDIRSIKYVGVSLDDDEPRCTLEVTDQRLAFGARDLGPG